jgi:oligopeptidase B
MPDSSLPISQPPVPPQAKQIPHVHSLHGDDRPDPYFWLRDRQNPDVIAHLEAENAYTEAVMQHTEAFQTALYQEMLGRIQETDLSVPYRKGEFYYYTRTEEGKAYSIFCRKRGSLDAPEELLLDQNELAAGHEYFALGVLKVSPDHQKLAYSVDTSGAEVYELKFLDLLTGKLYEETIAETYYSLAWGNDSQTVFYTQVDEAHRPYKLFRHTLGTPATQDELVYHEEDDGFYLGISKTRSEAYLLLNLDSKVTSEVHYLNADTPNGEFQVIAPRSPGVEYFVEHHSDRFYIVTNEDAINFKLMQAPVLDPRKDSWQMVLSHREDVLLNGVDAFVDHLIIYERKEGLPQIRVRKLSTNEEHYISFPEPTYEVEGDKNPEFDTQLFRYTYTSLITPSSVFDYNLETGAQELKKETPVLGGYDKQQYVSDRILVTAADGVKIPLSLVYRKGAEPNGNNPLLMVGYGSYGASYPDYFSSNRLSLLERGVVMAIAHIRGGSEMGRKWYEDGKFLHKKNTFTDFIACAEYLIQSGWTSPDHLAISGGSAGGLLMGAVLNMRPELFKMAIAQVPFVDVVTTILDESLPLSVMEWEEWGNPNDKTYYNYMKSYSPYDNVTVQDYPAMLVTAGLNDPRVSYWEPAKWVARLRDRKTDDHILLLKTNMGAGHGGASGRYGRLKEVAFEYAFLLDQWGLVD